MAQRTGGVARRLATYAQPDLGSLAQAVDTGARQPLSLETDQRQISFGDRVPLNVARIIALSAPGLSRLGVAEPNRQRDPDDTLTAFPSAFVYGMADESQPTTARS